MQIDRKQPSYLATDDLEQLARQNTNLMTELWIVKDRLAVLEHLLVEKGVLETQAVDDHEPTEALADNLDAERAAYIQRLMGVDPSERTVEILKKRAVTR